MFSLISAWINGWVNNGEVGDLRRHRSHYDVTVMCWKSYTLVNNNNDWISSWVSYISTCTLNHTTIIGATIFLTIKRHLLWAQLINHTSYMTHHASCIMHFAKPYKNFHGSIPGGWLGITNSDGKVYGVNMGPIWGRQDPGGHHVGPMNFAIWEFLLSHRCALSAWAFCVVRVIHKNLFNYAFMTGLWAALEHKTHHLKPQMI